MNNEMDGVIDLSAKRAHRLIDQGLDHFAKGDVHKAIESFKKSLELHETPEAYTCWGWMLSFKGELRTAIEMCKKAIAIDPEFGNPYNDIGTYYMKQGELREAMPWLEKAKRAKRSEPKHYPYLNLGRIYLSQGMFRKALAEFEVALEFDPKNDELRSVIERIKLNHG
jgi:tetratricopeptide (TPR) repeat protein